MKTQLGTTLLVSLALGAQFSAPTAQAQTPPAPLVAAQRINRQTVQETAAKLSRDSKVLIIADRSVATLSVSATLPGGTLEQTLTQLTAYLPNGATVKKLLLPPFLAGTTPDNDAIVALLSAQDALTVAVNGRVRPAPNSVNVLGKLVAAEKLPALIELLELRPVYILINPNAKSDTLGKMSQLQTDSLKMWTAMSPGERKAFVDKQWDDFFNMDAGSRQALIGQMMQMGQSMSEKMQSMTPEQREQLKREFQQQAPGGGGKP